MANKPMKRTGFRQGIYQQSSTKKEEIGTLRILRDGRKFRYAKAGGALSAGKANAVPAADAEVVNEACASAHAIGDMIIQETITAGVVHNEDQYAGGFFQVTDGTGEGRQYLIDSSSAVTAAGTTIILGLAEPIREVALVATTSEFSLVMSPWMEVAQVTAEENMPAGVAPINVTSGYYFWDQTGGVATVLGSDTSAVGTVVTLGATAGSVVGIGTPLDVDVAYSLGWVYGTAMVLGEYTQVFLTID